MRKRKILISPGFGGGWSADVCEDESEIRVDGRVISKAQAVAEYRPIIEYLESGGKPDSLMFARLVKMMKYELSLDWFSFRAGDDKLEVVEVEPPYKIEQYDGNEYVVGPRKLWY